MNQPFVTLDDALERVTRIVEQNPDYVYESPYGSTKCVYFYEDKPSCLIGQLLATYNITSRHMSQRSYTVPGLNSTINGVNVSTLAGEDRCPVDFAEDAIHFLDILQSHQDTGRFTWGQALEVAKEMLPDDYKSKL